MSLNRDMWRSIGLMVAGAVVFTAMFCWVVLENRNGPSGDANIGAGIVGLVGFALVALGAVGLIASYFDQRKK